MKMLSRRPVQMIAGVIVALALFGGGYAFGSSKAPAPTATTATGAAASGRVVQGAGGQANRGLTNGQIIAVNSDSITVQVRQGGQNGASPPVTPHPTPAGTAPRALPPP